MQRYNTDKNNSVFIAYCFDLVLVQIILKISTTKLRSYGNKVKTFRIQKMVYNNLLENDNFLKEKKCLTFMSLTTCWKSPPRAEHSLSRLSIASIFALQIFVKITHFSLISLPTIDRMAVT